MSDYTYIENLPELIVEIQPDSIISRVIHKDDTINTTVFGFDAGQSLSEHTATQPAIIHILAGEADITLGDDKHVAQAGTWIHMPPNLRHSITARTPLKMLLIMLKQGTR
ncbi:MAG: cupin domain-containing protein [Anaerolineae bacterium]|nr:cupin domain-containing protein [Anaerolineae bacterium]